MRIAAPALFLVVLGGASALRAEHARIELDVKAAGERQTAFVDQTPPDSGKAPRPVLRARVGDPIRVEWSFTNLYPHKTIEAALLYFYIAREDEVGQKELPDLEEAAGNVVTQSAVEVDFKPGTRAKGQQFLRIDRPGVYLIRLETRKTQSDHEHFAAIDLVIDPAER